MTQRLLVTLREDHVWSTLDGLLASQGQRDLLELPLDRLCNLVYWWLTKDANRSDPKGEQEFRKWEARLWRPPAGVAPESGPWSAEAETRAFRAFKAQVKPDLPKGAPAAPEPGKAPATPADPGGRQAAISAAAAAARRSRTTGTPAGRQTGSRGRPRPAR